MTADLGIFLGIIALVVGAAVWLVRLGDRGADADHAEKESDAVKKSQSQLDKFRARGGLRGAIERGLSKRPR